MTTRKVYVSYDHEGDMLEVLWAFREEYFTPTDDDRILKRLDDDEEIGFLIHEMSTLTEPSPVGFPANASVVNASTRKISCCTPSLLKIINQPQALLVTTAVGGSGGIDLLLYLLEFHSSCFIHPDAENQKLGRHVRSTGGVISGG